MPKKNPLNLNPLQLKTLTLFQELAKMEQYSKPDETPGHVMITGMPHPHGNHFHLGNYVLSSKDASGLGNEAAWIALERKGLMLKRRGAFVLTNVPELLQMLDSEK